MPKISAAYQGNKFKVITTDGSTITKNTFFIQLLLKVTLN